MLTRELVSFGGILGLELFPLRFSEFFRDLGNSVITCFHHFEKRVIIPQRTPKGYQKQCMKLYDDQRSGKKNCLRKPFFWQHAWKNPVSEKKHEFVGP